MSYSAWGTIAETPWWIYLIVLYVLKVAYQSTKPAFITLKSSMLFPSIVTSILIFSMASLIRLDFYQYLLLALSLVPGLILGCLQFHFRRIKAIKSKNQFYIPGSWSVFVIVFTLFLAKFYFYGFNFSLNAEALKQNNNSLPMIALCGLMIGLMIGRMGSFYRCMKVGPFIEK